MGGAGIKARGAPSDERQQPRHRADEAGPSGASGCASRVASSALVAKNRDRPIGRTNMDILKGPEADCERGHSLRAQPLARSRESGELALGGVGD